MFSGATLSPTPMARARERASFWDVRGLHSHAPPPPMATQSKPPLVPVAAVRSVSTGLAHSIAGLPNMRMSAIGRLAMQEHLREASNNSQPRAPILGGLTESEMIRLAAAKHLGLLSGAEPNSSLNSLDPSVSLGSRTRSGSVRCTAGVPRSSSVPRCVGTIRPSSLHALRTRHGLDPRHLPAALSLDCPGGQSTSESFPPSPLQTHAATQCSSGDHVHTSYAAAAMAATAKMFAQGTFSSAASASLLDNQSSRTGEAIDSGAIMLYKGISFGGGCRCELPEPSSHLGSVQPAGRVEVMKELLRQRHELSQFGKVGKPRGEAVRGGSLGGLLRAVALSNADGTPDLQWSTLSEAQKLALKQWVGGTLGGRHCMLILDQGFCADSLGHHAEEPSAKQLKGGGALNLLSGFRTDGGLVGGEGGGWLFREVFSKEPKQVLEDALQAAIEETGDREVQQLGGLSAEQAHLALRRIALKAQSMITELPSAPEEEATVRALDRCLRAQVWLELLHLHLDGGGRGSSGGGSSSSSRPVANTADARGGTGTAKDASSCAFIDSNVLVQLGKAESELENDSQRMDLDALRAQNRAIEEYVMRLLRQRDELRQMAKAAEERDSYFILGLEGPQVSEEDLKKAYRNLARKEHPDKAGVGNKQRFQAIQHAYDSIIRKRSQADNKNGNDSPTVGASNRKAKSRVVGVAGIAAAKAAARVVEAADLVAASAHRALRGQEEAALTQGVGKRRSLRRLMDLTRAGVAELKSTALQLHALGDLAVELVQLTEDAIADQVSRSSATGVAAISLRDQAVMVEDAGRASVSSAELLEKISEATEATVHKVEHADQKQAVRTGATDAATAALVKLGVQLLTESLGRTAAVARRCADEAISGAAKALELSRGITTLYLERSDDDGNNGDSDDEDKPMAAPDAEDRRTAAAQSKSPQEKPPDTSSNNLEPTTDRKPSKPKQSSPSEALKSVQQRVKDRHIALRVKNLLFLSNLNEEALRSQAKLWELLERSAGTLLPVVSLSEKQNLFNLALQLLDSSAAEAARLARGPAGLALGPVKIVERSLSFALALEHTQEIAMPTDTRTQVLKLAGLVDTDLLCQVVNGPFRESLQLLGEKAREASADPACRLLRIGATRSNVRSQSAQPFVTSTDDKAWDEAVSSCCARISAALRRKEPAASGA